MIAPLLVFNRPSNSLTLITADGCLTCHAANNVVESSRGPWPKGVFKAEKLVRLPPPDDDPGGSFGKWFIRYVVPDRDGIDDALDLYGDHKPDENDGAGVGMGIHAGRRYGRGWQSATHGCIRGDTEGLDSIVQAICSAAGVPMASTWVVLAATGALPDLWVPR